MFLRSDPFWWMSPRLLHHFWTLNLSPTPTTTTITSWKCETKLLGIPLFCLMLSFLYSTMWNKCQFSVIAASKKNVQGVPCGCNIPQRSFRHTLLPCLTFTFSVWDLVFFRFSRWRVLNVHSFHSKLSSGCTFSQVDVFKQYLMIHRLYCKITIYLQIPGILFSHNY